MVERTGHQPGTPSWADVSTTDLDAAKDFYCGLFGWDAEDQMHEGVRVYTMFSLRGKSVAGGGQMPEEQQNSGMPPMWSTYISVADVDETVEAVSAAGGEVVMPSMDVFDSGRMAIFMDPTGAMFSVWQPREHIGAELVSEPGTMVWNECGTREPVKAAEFYSTIFGWEVTEIGTPGSTYREAKLGGNAIAGIFEMGDDFPPEIPSNWLVYFDVEDLDSAVGKAESLGGKVEAPVMDIGGARFAVVSDPQGAVFAVHEYKEEQS